MSDNMEKTLTFRLLGDTSGLKSSLQNADKETKGLSDTMKTLGKVIGTAFTVTAITGFVKQIASTGKDFEYQMAKVKAISGATEDDFKKLEEEARRLGATTMFSATESAEGLEYFAMAGWSAEDSISALEPTLRLAQASGTDLGTTADILSDSLTAFGMESKDAGKFADLLASASSNSNTNVQMLGESFKYVAPLMGTMGGSAEDTALALGLMANAGIKGSQAGTTLKTSIANLVNPTNEMKQAMDDVGFSVAYADDGSLDLQGTMDRLRESFSTLTPEQQAQAGATMFGKEAMAGMLAIVNTSTEDYAKLTQATEEYTGKASEMAGVMEDTLQGRIANLKSAWEEVQLVMYEKLLPVFELVVGGLTKLIQWVGNLETNIKEAFGKNTETIEKFKQFFDGVRQKIIEIFDKLVQTVMNWYKENKATIDRIIEAFKVFLANVGEVINLVLDIIKMFIDVFTEYFLNYGLAIIDGLMTAFSGIVDIIKGVLQIIKGIFTGDWALIWEGAKNVFTGIWEAMVGVLEIIVGRIKAQVNFVLGFINKLISAWNKLKFKVPEVTIPFVGTFGGQEVSVKQIKSIPLLAEGGIITQPTLAMIGEGGESEAVIPLSKLDSFNKGVNGLVVNVYGSVGVDDIGEQLVQTLRRKGVMSFA